VSFFQKNEEDFTTNRRKRRRVYHKPCKHHEPALRYFYLFPKKYWIYLWAFLGL